MAEQMMQEAAGKAIPAGYKQTEVGVIPEDWDVAMLRDISAKITDGTHDTPKPVIEGIPFLTAIHVKDGMIDFDGCYFLPESIHNEIYRRCNPEFGDILMVNIGSGTATTAVVNVNYEFSLKNVALIKPNKGNNGFYINYALGFSKNKIIDTIMTGGAQPFLSLTQIALLQVPVPSLEEQTAIANVLSDSDALIGALEQLIAKKQAIKSATMQQLLTGRTRLPAFALRPDGTPKGYKPSELGDIPEDWACYTFNDVVDSCSSGATPYRGNKDFYKGTNRWITSGELNYCIINDTIEKISDEAIKKSNLNVHPQGTFLMAITGLEAAGTRGACGIVGRPATTNQSCMAIYPNEKLSSAYLYYWYVHNGENLAFKYCQGTKQLSYTAGLIKKIPLYLPTIKEEQTAIATILSDMDNELQALTQKLEKARELKQGMMQQLLTGKIRLPLPPNTTQGASDAN